MRPGMQASLAPSLSAPGWNVSPKAATGNTSGSLRIEPTWIDQRPVNKEKIRGICLEKRGLLNYVAAESEDVAGFVAGVYRQIGVPVLIPTIVDHRYALVEAGLPWDDGIDGGIDALLDEQNEAIFLTLECVQQAMHGSRTDLTTIAHEVGHYVKPCRHNLDHWHSLLRVPTQAAIGEHWAESFALKHFPCSERVENHAKQGEQHMLTWYTSMLGNITYHDCIEALITRIAQAAGDPSYVPPKEHRSFVSQLRKATADDELTLRSIGWHVARLMGMDVLAYCGSRLCYPGYNPCRMEASGHVVGLREFVDPAGNLTARGKRICLPWLGHSPLALCLTGSPAERKAWRQALASACAGRGLSMVYVMSEGAGKTPREALYHVYKAERRAALMKETKTLVVVSDLGAHIIFDLLGPDDIDSSLKDWRLSRADIEGRYDAILSHQDKASMAHADSLIASLLTKRQLIVEGTIPPDFRFKPASPRVTHRANQRPTRAELLAKYASGLEKMGRASESDQLEAA